MILKNITLAFRHILRYRAYTIINIASLAIGMACAMIIFLWANQQLSMDKFHKNLKNIYILHKWEKLSEQGSTDISMTYPYASVLATEIPEVKAAVRVSWNQKILFRLGEKAFFENGIYTDSTFFRVFSYKLLLGDSATALNNRNSVVISEKLAHKYFGKENPVGKTIMIRQKQEEPFVITGVLKELPHNSSFDFDFLLTYSKFNEVYKEWCNWGNYSWPNYILTQPNTNLKILNEKLTQTLYKYSDWPKRIGMQIFAQPLEDKWLYDEYNGTTSNSTGLILYIKIFMAIAWFIILLACMNYTNLATALATKRAREVGVKKVFGSDKAKLIGQFIIESVGLSFVSFFLSIVLVELALPSFNAMFKENMLKIYLDYSNPRVIEFMIFVPLITGLLAGIFPALYLSSLKPLNALKKALNIGKGNIQLRHVLIVFQFVITIVFIVSSLVVKKQIVYMQNKKLGLDKDNLIIFRQNTQIIAHRNAFKTEILKQPGVVSATYTDGHPLNIHQNTSDPEWRGKSPGELYFITNMNVDPDFGKTMGAEIIEGRDFSNDSPSDTNCLLVNQKMVKIMKLEDPVGERIRYWGRTATIIGIVKDFHYNNMRVPIMEMMIICRPNNTSLMVVKLRGGQVKEGLHHVEKVFKNYEPNVPFEYQFIDEDVKSQYEDSIYLGWFALIFTILSILISCLGLFGLSLFIAEQRTKEIGIRKSNGATTFQIMKILAIDFAKWIIIAFIIASGIAYYLLHSWLNEFAYRTDLSWWIFILTGIIAILIALITVSWQSWRAASKNPVESLRYE